MAKKRKNLILKKFSKQKAIYKFPYIITGISYFICLSLFARSLLLLAGVETAIRFTLILLLYLLLPVYFLLGIVSLYKKKTKKFFLIIIIFALLCPAFMVGSKYINKTYNIIDTAQKKYVEYTSVMISLNDVSQYSKIGMINEKKDPTGYIIPQDIIKENKITAQIEKYEDYASMLTSLYAGEIDAMFVEENYVSLFSSYEQFQNIGEETKVIYKKSKKLENQDNVSYSSKELTEPFTVLLMGVDGTGSGIGSGSFNGDTLMLISFNPKTLSATIFSIPRDTYVPIACNGNKENKINSSAYGGTSCVVNTIQNLTGIDIDYYVKINFTGVVSLVDDLGGVYVDVPITFCEQDSERRFGEYEICLEAGPQTLNGEQALALSRHRHSLPLGDFQRVQHQQLVLEAMIQSAKKISNIEDFYKILNDVSNNIDTNMSTQQILSLYKVGKNILLNKIGNNKSIAITKTYLTGYDFTIYNPSMRGNVYTFQYYKQSLDDIVHAMKVNLEIEKPRIIKNFSFDANEIYEVKVAGKENYNEQRRELLPDFTGQGKAYVESWGISRNINVNFKEEDSNLPNGTIIGQSEHSGIILDTIKSISFTVSNGKKKDNDSNNPTENGIPNDSHINTTEGKTETIENTEDSSSESDKIENPALDYSGIGFSETDKTIDGEGEA